jgi:hypothetical protein
MSGRLEKAQRAAELREQGYSVTSIGRLMGISRSYASGLLTDPDGSKDRARKESYGGVCEECGGPTSGAEGPAHVARWCYHCGTQKHRSAVCEPSDDAAYEDRALLDALDFPPELIPLQNAYWEKRREFRRMEEAYLVCVRFVLDSLARAEARDA